MKDVLRVFACDNGVIIQVTKWGDPTRDKEPCSPCQKRAQVVEQRHVLVTESWEKMMEAIEAALMNVRFDKDCGCGGESNGV